VAVSRRVRIVLWLAGAVAITAIVLSATVAFVVFRSITSTVASVTDADKAFAEIRRQYPDRAPLIEVIDMRTADVRINRTPNAPRKDVSTVYFMTWDPEDQKIVHGEAPTWITSVRASITGVGNWSFSDFHVTREDIERYSPGIILDIKSAGGVHVIAWTVVPAVAPGR
jgi:hypothetical protein